MLRNQEKNSLVRGIFLIGGQGLDLDRFYEGDKKGGFLIIKKAFRLAKQFENA